MLKFIFWSLTLTLAIQACYAYHLTWARVPRIVREMSGNLHCLESGHLVNDLELILLTIHCYCTLVPVTNWSSGESLWLYACKSVVCVKKHETVGAKQVYVLICLTNCNESFIAAWVDAYSVYFVSLSKCFWPSNFFRVLYNTVTQQLWWYSEQLFCVTYGAISWE